MSRVGWFAVVLILSACGGTDDATGGPRLRGPGAKRAADSGTSVDGGALGLTDDEGAPDSGASVEEGPEESGEATYYDATSGLGACGIKAPADYLVAAINDEQYSKANCGRCASVTGPNGTVVVRVIDKCPGCGSGDLDLSEQAFAKIASKSAGRVKITWRFVACSS